MIIFNFVYYKEKKNREIPDEKNMRNVERE